MVNYREEIDYVATMTTGGNAQDFGHFTSTSKCCGSGQIQMELVDFLLRVGINAINVNTIATTGNASSFGSLSSITIMLFSC